MFTEKEKNVKRICKIWNTFQNKKENAKIYSYTMNSYTVKCTFLANDLTSCPPQSPQKCPGPTHPWRYTWLMWREPIVLLLVALETEVRVPLFPKRDLCVCVCGRIKEIQDLFSISTSFHLDSFHYFGIYSRIFPLLSSWPANPTAKACFCTVCWLWNVVLFNERGLCEFVAGNKQRRLKGV